MKFRLVIVVAGLLIFAQIINYGYIQTQNIEMLNREIVVVQNDIQQLNAERINLNQRVKQLKNIIESIPPYLLMGFEDPETGFVEFLDFLNNPILEEVGGKISMRELQQIKEDPIPVHESRFNFRFKFLETFEAEKFLNFLLMQEQYPLQVRDLRLRRSKGEKTEGELAISLLIPAKLQLPELSQEADAK
jgi:hypothetical protein